jgi:predicted regulator of Ras-like GTPase activity (Roadblock/LC7/MglB family)
MHTYPVITMFAHSVQLAQQIAHILQKQFSSSVRLSTCTTPAALLQSVRQQAPQAVVIALDPEGIGLALAREVQEQCADMPILVVHAAETPAFQRTFVERLGIPVAPLAPQHLVVGLVRLLMLQSRADVAPVAPGRRPVQMSDLASRGAELLRGFNDVPGVECALFADLGGLPLAQWQRLGTKNVADVAALAAGTLSATLKLAHLLGARTPGSILVQEFDDQTILISRVSPEHFLLVALTPDTALGPIRLFVRRMSADLLTFVRTGHPHRRSTDTLRLPLRLQWVAS